MAAIRDLEIGEETVGFYVIHESRVREYIKSGSAAQFLSLELGDATGRIPAVWWEWSPSAYPVETLCQGTVVKVKAVVGEFNDSPQLKIEQLRIAREGDYTPEQFVRVSTQTEEQVRERVSALVAQVRNPHLRALIASFFDDERMFKAYLRAAAAEMNHHAWIRGLAEHSCNVAEIALSLAPRYPYLDPDLLIFGGLFHDYGKVASYDITTRIARSLEGQLLDHIAIADAEITAHAKAIEDFPAELLTRVRHVILAHHGKREFGSPVLPQMAEAILLNLVDQIDAWVGGALGDAGASIEFDGWTEKLWMLDRQRFYFVPRGDVKK